MEYFWFYLKNLFYQLFWTVFGILLQVDAMIEISHKGWKSYKERFTEKTRIKISVFLIIIGFFYGNYNVFYNTKKEFEEYKQEYFLVKSKEQLIKENNCNEIGKRKFTITEYFDELDNFHNNFNQKKFDDFKKSVDHWLKETANWIRKNIGNGAYSDFVVIDDLPYLGPTREYTPEGKVRLNLKNFEKNLTKIENNYCRDK